MTLLVIIALLTYSGQCRYRICDELTLHDWRICNKPVMASVGVITPGASPGATHEDSAMTIATLCCCWTKVSEGAPIEVPVRRVPLATMFASLLASVSSCEAPNSVVRWTTKAEIVG